MHGKCVASLGRAPSLSQASYLTQREFFIVTDISNSFSSTPERTDNAQSELEADMVRTGQERWLKQERKARLTSGATSLPHVRRILLALHETACSNLSKHLSRAPGTGRREAGRFQLALVAERHRLPVLTSVLLAATGSLLLRHNSTAQSYFCDQVGRAVREYEEHAAFKKDFEKWSRLQRLEWSRSRLSRQHRRAKARDLHKLVSGQAPSERHENTRTQMGAAWLGVLLDLGLVEVRYRKSTRGNKQPFVHGSETFHAKVEALSAHYVEQAWVPQPMLIPPRLWDEDDHLWGGAYGADIPPYGFCKDWSKGAQA